MTAIVLLLFLLETTLTVAGQENNRSCVITGPSGGISGQPGWRCVRWGRERCLHKWYWCNGGYSYCDNNEDEQCSTKIENGESFCQNNITGEKKRGFWCESGGRQKCSNLCDGVSQCDNNEDEQCGTKIENGVSFCQHNRTGEKKRGFWCESGGRQKCISFSTSNLCDGV